MENVHEKDFRKLVDNHRMRVITTCYGFLNNQEDAEDTAQEVFLEVYKSLDKFRGDSSLDTWIYRIAVTKSLDLLRKRNRKKRIGKFMSKLGLDSYSDTIPAKDSELPDKATEKNERTQLLLSKVEELPENQRVAIMLNQYQGFGYKEIAEIMGTTVSSVESLLVRAKKNLRKSLTKHYEFIFEKS